MAHTTNDQVSAHMTTTDPKDFSESGGDHRKSLLASSALILVLQSAPNPEPTVFGITVSPFSMWLFLTIAQIYFFVMWRLTTNIESDREKRFWNFRGLIKQAIAGGTHGFPGKTKAQLIFIRALPIWAFITGLCTAIIGLLKNV